jgi:hypothetical protein
LADPLCLSAEYVAHFDFSGSDYWLHFSSAHQGPSPSSAFCISRLISGYRGGRKKKLIEKFGNEYLKYMRHVPKIFRKVKPNGIIKIQN